MQGLMKGLQFFGNGYAIRTEFQTLLTSGTSAGLHRQRLILLFGPFFVFTGVKPKMIQGSMNRTPKGNVFGELRVEADTPWIDLAVTRNAIQRIVAERIA